MSIPVKADVMVVCWFGAFRCILTQCQEENTLALILEKQLLLPIMGCSEFFTGIHSLPLNFSFPLDCILS